MVESHLMWHHLPRVDHLKIESQRLDLKPIYNKIAPAEKEIRAKRKKKKTEEEEINLGWRDLGCTTQVTRPGSPRAPGRATQVMRPG